MPGFKRNAFVAGLGSMTNTIGRYGGYRKIPKNVSYIGNRLGVKSRYGQSYGSGTKRKYKIKGSSYVSRRTTLSTEYKSNNLKTVMAKRT